MQLTTFFRSRVNLFPHKFVQYGGNTRWKMLNKYYIELYVYEKGVCVTSHTAPGFFAVGQFAVKNEKENLT